MRRIHYDFDRPRKNVDRLTMRLDLKPRRAALLMPSHQALDVSGLLASGVLTRDTRQVWIESEKTIVEKLHRFKTDHDLPNVEIIHTKLEDFQPHFDLDYVNADTMGAMGLELAEWLSAIQPRLHDGATVIVTVTHHFRRNNFLEWMEETGYVRDDLNLPAELLGELSGSNHELLDLLPQVVLACALSSKTFEWHRVNFYRDTRWPMMSMRIDNIAPHLNSPWPSIATLKASFLDEFVGRAHATGPRSKPPEQDYSELYTRFHTMFSAFEIMNVDGKWCVRNRVNNKIMQEFATAEELEAAYL